MIPGIRRGLVQRLVTIAAIIFLVCNFFECLDIELLKHVDDKLPTIAKEIYIFILFLFGILLIRKIIFLLKVKYKLEKCIEELENYLYVGTIYILLTLKNYYLFSNNERKIVFNIYVLIFFAIFFSYVYFYNEEKEREDKLFSSREKEIRYLEDILKLNGSHTILLEGEWGRGKTYFINEFLERKKEEYICIKIKASLFGTKEEIRKFLFQELETILENYNIRSSNIVKMLNKIELKKNRYLKELLNEKSLLEEEKENIKKIFSIIKKKKIILVLDDIERVPKCSERKEIISLLSEFEDIMEVKKIILTNLDEIGVELKYLEKYVDVKFSLSNIDYDEIIDELIPKQYSDIYKKTLDNLNEILKGNKRIDLQSDRIYKEVKKIENIILNPRVLKQINLNFYRYRLNKICEKEKNFDVILESFILYEIIKTYYQDFFKLLKNENENYYLINLRLKNVNKLEDPIFKILELLMGENYIKQEYFMKFINHIEIFSRKDEMKQQISEIFKKYSNKNKWLQYRLNLKEELIKDAKKIFLIKNTMNIVDENNLKEFRNNYKNILFELYNKGKLDIIDIFELFISEYFYSNEKIEVNLFKIKFPQNMIEDYNLKQRFFNLDFLLWNNYKSLIILFFGIHVNRLERNFGLKKFNYTKKILGIEDEVDINEILKKLDEIRKENKIEENEPIYLSLKENLIILSEIYENYESEVQQKSIRLEEYTYENFKEDEHELKEKMDIYQFKYLEKIKNI